MACTPQIDYENRPYNVVAAISNCADLHPKSRVQYIKELMESTPELGVQFYGSCGTLGRYPGSKKV
jgi:hypothetical protein